MEIKGYITNLGKYNEGELIGEWITFPIDDDELDEVLKRIGINEEYEEYFFTDWEAYGLNIGEYASIDEINELAYILQDVDDEIVLSIIEEYDNPYDVMDIVRGEKYNWFPKQTLTDVAEYNLRDILNEWQYDFIEQYFDFDSYADELTYDDYHETEYGVIQYIW